MSAKSKLLNAVISGMTKVAKLLSEGKDVSTDAVEAVVLLNYAAISAAEKDRPAVPGAKKGKNEQVADWTHLKITLAEALKTTCESSALPGLYGTNADLEELVKYASGGY